VKEPIWLDRVDCIAIHEFMLAQHGGLGGVRDPGLLESALARPRRLFEYGSPTLARIAGSYAAGVIQNHPFNDGNKRTGFMLAAAFLELNGVTIAADEEQAFRKTLALAAGEIDEGAYANWLSTVSAPRRANRN